MTRDLIRQLLRADVQLAAAERFSGDACSGLRRLQVEPGRVQDGSGPGPGSVALHFLSAPASQDEDVRIIVGHFEDGSVTDVFCCVSELRVQVLVLNVSHANMAQMIPEPGFKRLKESRWRPFINAPKLPIFTKDGNFWCQTIWIIENIFTDNLIIFQDGRHGCDGYYFCDKMSKHMNVLVSNCSIEIKYFLLVLHFFSSWTIFKMAAMIAMENICLH